MSKILVLDVESTGISNHPIYGHPQIIELAYADVTDLLILSFTEEQLRAIPVSNERFFPSMPIHPEATKIHGIQKKDLFGCKKSETITLPEMKYIVGHNAAFDKRCLNMKEVPEICTMALAKTISKQLKIKYENFKLDTLAAHYYPEVADTLVTKLHSANNDVLKTLLVLVKLVEHLPTLKTLDDVYNFQQSLKKKSK
jgi:DNA polymerase III epsilon subunit-like protein